MFFGKKNEDKDVSETVKTAEAEKAKDDEAAAGSSENISGGEKTENKADEKTDGPEKIQKEVLVAELVTKHPELVEPLMMMGMHCISCFASQMETLEEAAMVHGLNPDEVVEDLNQFLADEKSGKVSASSESMFY